MELRVEELQLPQEIRFNYDELKKELSEKVKLYETLVYSDDQIKSAKADRADLNRLKKALNDERIRREKEYMKPFNEFKAQINEIIGIIDNPVKLIDERIKDFEEQKKQEKKQKIEEYFGSCMPHIPVWLHLPMIWDEKWLNASVSMKSIQEQIDVKNESIKSDIETLSNLPEFAFEAIETYKSTLDLNKSIAEGHRLSEMQKRKAEQERIKAEQEKVRAEQDKMCKEQEETLRRQMRDSLAERGRQAATVTEEEIAQSAEDYREAASANGVHIFDGGYLAKEEVVEPPKELPMYVCFKALLTVAQARELKEFFESRNIEFSRI